MGDTSTTFTNTTQKDTVLSKSQLLKTNWSFGSYQVSYALYHLIIYFKYQNTVGKNDVKDRLALLLPSVLTYRQKHRQSDHRYFLFYTKHFSVMRLYWETSSGSNCRSTSAKPAVRRSPQQRTSQVHREGSRTVKHSNLLKHLLHHSLINLYLRIRSRYVST